MRLQSFALRRDRSEHFLGCFVLLEWYQVPPLIRSYSSISHSTVLTSWIGLRVAETSLILNNVISTELLL